MAGRRYENPANHSDYRLADGPLSRDIGLTVASVFAAVAAGCPQPANRFVMDPALGWSRPSSASIRSTWLATRLSSAERWPMRGERPRPENDL